MIIRCGRVIPLFIWVLSGCTHSAVIPITTTPSATPTLEQTPSIRTLASPTLIPSATLSMVEVALGDCWMRDLSLEQGTKRSPDGRWLAFFCYNLEGPLGFEKPRIEIVQLDHTRIWRYSFEELTGQTPCTFFPTHQYPEGCYIQVVWSIDHWSKESRHVFYAIDLVLDRAVYPRIYFGLYRVDVWTGNISAWLPFTGLWYVYAFSPDENYLVYATQIDGYWLHINSIDAGKSTVIKLPGMVRQISNMAWSPDSQTMAVSAQYDNGQDTQGTSSLFALSVADMRLDTLISDDPRLWHPLGWVSEKILTVAADNMQYQYDLESHTLMPTPVP